MPMSHMDLLTVGHRPFEVGGNWKWPAGAALIETRTAPCVSYCARIDGKCRVPPKYGGEVAQSLVDKFPDGFDDSECAALASSTVRFDRST